MQNQQVSKESLEKIDEWIKKHESDIQDMLPLKKSVKELTESQEYDWERFTEIMDDVEWIKEDLKSLRISIALMYDVVRQMQNANKSKNL